MWDTHLVHGISVPYSHSKWSLVSNNSWNENTYILSSLVCIHIVGDNLYLQ